MTHDWKPGDVARTRAGGTVARTIARKWVLLEDGLLMNLDHEPRPLLVIDPESVVDLESVWIAVRNARGLQSRANMQAALRSLLAPPKPEEPTGLGAVVEDRAGEMWVRTAPGEFDKPWYRGDTIGIHAHWKTVDAARILSAGVTDAA